MNQQNFKRYVKRAALAVLILAVGSCLTVPALRAWLGEVFVLLSSMDVDRVVNYLRSFGAWAAVISFCLMILQSVAAPIPAFLITFANAVVFGWWQGAILSWCSALAGAAVCFWIARLLGRDVVEKLVSRTALSSMDVFFERYGKHTVLICRLLPFVSFDLVSYAAGLTGMGFWGFFLATGIGQLPATIVYSYVGGMLTGDVKLFVTALFILFAFTVLIALFRKIYRGRKEETTDETE